MATIALAPTTYAGHPTADAYSHKSYVVEKYIDLAAAVTSKGSALAQADVIEALAIPAGSLVEAAGFEVIAAMTGTSTDATLDFGITGVDVDAFVDGFDLDAAAVGAYSAIPAATIGGKYLVTTADTLDLLIATQTNTITGGELRVWAVVTDVSKRKKPGLATPGS